MSKTPTNSLFSLFSGVGYVQNYLYKGYRIKRDSYMQAYEVIKDASINGNGITEIVYRWFPKKEDAETWIRAQQQVAHS